MDLSLLSSLIVEHDGDEVREPSPPKYKWQAFLDRYMENLEDFERMYEKFPLERVRAISARDRENIGDTPTLSYSEIEYESFGTLLLELQDFDLPPRASYYDLGAGVGKTVFAAYYLGIFNKCTGIEILPSLYRTCELTLRQFNIYNSFEDFEKPDLHYLQGDTTYIDWSASADVVFSHCTCYDSTQMDRLGNMASRMKPASFFICLSNR